MAANYQTYVAALGTAEVAYAVSNASHFDGEMTTIDAADETAANDTVNTDETLSITLTNDEATFEETLAEAGAAYQIAIGESAQGYRKGVAQADHDLIVETAENDPEAEADYNDEMAAAQEAKTTAIDEAYAAFAEAVDPAMTLQGTDDTNAEETDNETDAGATFTDVEQNNQAIDTYDDQESGDYSGQQIAGATALSAMLTANANGNAAAIASFDQSNPSPWTDLANWQAAAQATQQVSQAAAQVTQSTALDNAQASEEEGQSDATTAQDDAQAEAEETQTDGDAEAADSEALAQAAATDAVFSYLPDTLVAPSDGPAPALAPDYVWGYEASDYYLYPTFGSFGYPVSEFGIGWEDIQTSAPSFVGTGTNAFNTTAYSFYIPFTPHDILRNLTPDTANYQPPMHLTGGAAELLDLTNTPSNIGQGGYSQSPLPTAQGSGELSTPSTGRDLSDSLVDVPRVSQNSGGIYEQLAFAQAETNDEATGQAPASPFDGLNEDDTEILNRAAAELDAKGFSQENKALRLWVLRAAITANVDNIGNERSPVYWKERNGDGSFVANTPDVLSALENLLTGHGNKVFCNKLAALMIIHGVVKYFQSSGDTEMVARIQTLLSPEYRDWKTNSGTVADAAYMGLENGKALLMQKDGTVRQVSLDDFSAEDRSIMTGGVRTWTSASGTRTVDGEFIGTNSTGKMLIVTPAGGRYAIAFDNFSDADQEFLDEHGGGLKINEDLPQGGIDLFWRHVPEEGTKEFKVDDLTPGDQVWFQNPYYRTPEKATRPKRQLSQERKEATSSTPAMVCSFTFMEIRGNTLR